MKTVCVMDSISRANGGIFEAERHLQQHLNAQPGMDVRIVGLQDEFSRADLDAWSPLMPQTMSVTGPRAFGYAPGLIDALGMIDADLGYLVGLWKYPSIATAHWSVRAKKPVMIAPHGMLDPWALKNSGTKKRMAGWLFQNDHLRKAACLRALCTAEAESMRAYELTNPICVIPNGVELPSVAPNETRRHPRLPSGPKVLLYLGRLHPKKGLVPLLAAWKKVNAKSQDWILAIAGWDQGGHESELKDLTTALGLSWTDGAGQNSKQASVHFLGPQFGEMKEACYRSCDAFVLPSLSEGLPMVVLEAWAYGKPVLMTPACNLSEGFASQAAWRIEPTAESIAKTLTSLLMVTADDLRIMGSKGRVLVEEKFDWPRVARQMAAAYEWMLGGGPRPESFEGR